MRIYETFELKDKWKILSGNWNGCSRCHLGETCTKNVLGRGRLPADLLFIGEAPGPDEDLRGEPFIGRAGKILECLIRDARKVVRKKGGDPLFTYFITNTVACYPDDGHGGFRVPTLEEMESCKDRVICTINLADPRGIVLLGKTALTAYSKIYTKNLKTWKGSPKHLFHPSYLARRGGTSSLDYKNTYYALADYLLSLPERSSS